VADCNRLSQRELYRGDAQNGFRQSQQFQQSQIPAAKRILTVTDKENGHADVELLPLKTEVLDHATDLGGRDILTVEEVEDEEEDETGEKEEVDLLGDGLVEGLKLSLGEASERRGDVDSQVAVDAVLDLAKVGLVGRS
jgi:microcompartment protein CcmK/EutM